MILGKCQDMVNDYVERLRQKISIEDIDGVCEITTPFLDRHNDHIQIYVKRSNGGFALTDDGYTIKDLRLSGFEFSTEKRKQLLNATLNGFGVTLVKDELFVEARPNNFPQKKHNLLQAMLAVNDFYIKAEPMTTRAFREEVERYLRLHQVRFTPSVKFTGRTNFDHSFDFVIPASQAKPERILKTISRVNRPNITLLIFAWSDTKEVREPHSTAFGILNDAEHAVNPDLMTALRQYNVNPVLWSDKDQYVQEFAL